MTEHFDEIQFEILTRVIQLIIIGFFGGAISWFYSKIQKTKENRIRLIEEYSKLYGNFISLRFKYNIQFMRDKKGNEKPIAIFMSQKNEGIDNNIAFYKEACNLIGQYQGLRPVLSEFFPNTTKELSDIYNYFQEYRRKIRDNKPIHQNSDWTSTESYTQMKKTYSKSIKIMRNKI